MQQKHPQMKAESRRGEITWIGPWQPEVLCNTYLVKVRYKLNLPRPQISILTPRLQLAKGKTRLPHVYKGGQDDICVHTREDWNPSLLIADTIMPWISEWLFFYEAWLQTGYWEGKGTNPEWPSHKSRTDEGEQGANEESRPTE
jgi:hypothetical protein